MFSPEAAALCQAGGGGGWGVGGGGSLMLCQDFLSRCWSHNTHRICFCASSPAQNRLLFGLCPPPQYRGGTDQLLHTITGEKTSPGHVIGFAMKHRGGAGGGEGGRRSRRVARSEYRRRRRCRGPASSEGSPSRVCRMCCFSANSLKGGR